MAREHLDAAAILVQLGAGRSVADICRDRGLATDDFQSWWRSECLRRLPSLEGRRRARVGACVTISRDAWGVPFIDAASDTDVAFGYGYAMAQDRLFQMDHQRRLGTGRLAEVVGSRGVESDRAARIVGLPGIAHREAESLSDETTEFLDSFARGVDAARHHMDTLPIEFDLLGYEPEPWRAVDCLVIAGAFRWYLTGRLAGIVNPELLRMELGDTGLYEYVLETERGDDDEIIVPVSPALKGTASATGPGATATDADQGAGSNNWVVAGSRTRSGHSIVAGDPHIAFGAVSCWYEARLRGGAYDVGGAGYVGVPGILFGRNRHVAWTITNNLCSQRDLYREVAHPTEPDVYRGSGGWQRATIRHESIAVRGAEPVAIRVASTANGPIVDELLPTAATTAGRVSLRWMGAEMPCDFVGALLRLARVECERDVDQAIDGWVVPTFNLVVGDRHDHVGYRATGRLPVRTMPERGFRPATVSEHHWQGLIPTEAMPRWSDPERGWIASANNRTAPDGFPFHLAGIWDQPYRARRIHQLLDGDRETTAERMVEFQQDVLSLRALECRDALLGALEADVSDATRHRARSVIEGWDGRLTTDSVAATIFEVFFDRWMTAVASARVKPELRPSLTTALRGTATALLTADPAGWFEPGQRDQAMRGALDDALTWLRERLGDDPDAWQWGRLHRLRLHHALSWGDMGALLGRGDMPVPGDNATVFNTGIGPEFEAGIGSNLRMVTDLGSDPPEYLAADAQGQSGNPGSPHYGDQQDIWIAATYRRVSFAGPSGPTATLELVPVTAA